MKAAWVTKKLREFAAEISTGPFGSVLHKADYVDHGVPLVNPINIVNDEILPNPSKLISDSTKQRLAAYVLKEGDIVVARRGEIGRCAVVTSSQSGWVCGTGSFFIRPIESVDSRFMANLIRSAPYREKLEQASTGTTMKNLSNTALGELVVTLPSLSEQRRIVAIIEEAFASIALAKAIAEKNLQNAWELFESYLQEAFNRRGGGWSELSLGEIATFRNGLNFTQSSRGETVKIVGVKDFQQNFWAPLDALEEVTIEGELPDNDLLKENDLLFVRSNGNVDLIGRSLLVGKVAGKIAHSGFAIRARLTNDAVSARYLCHFLKSNNARRRMIAGGIGTNIKSLNQTILSSLVIPLPRTLLEQTRIADEFEKFESQSRSLESIYERKLAALDELKQSLLDEAFSGKL